MSYRAGTKTIKSTNNKNFFFHAFVLSILLFGCNTNDDTKGSCTSNPNAQTLSHDGETREYILYVPDSYDGTSEVPLLLNFHGFGGFASEYMNYAGMRPLAESEEFILVYPQGTCLDGSSHWNAGLESPDNKSNADDFGFTNALINELSSNYMIDLERVYACGYSNGAFFSYALACYYSDRIAAIGSVSGTMLDTTSTCTPSHPMAMINIHGTSDSIVPYEGNFNYNAIETVLNFWISFNNTMTTPISNGVNDNGTRIERYQYTGGNSNVSVEHYKIIEGEHVWFEINYQGSNTGKSIWDFVSQYDINGLR